MTQQSLKKREEYNFNVKNKKHFLQNWAQISGHERTMLHSEKLGHFTGQKKSTTKITGTSAAIHCTF